LGYFHSEYNRRLEIVMEKGVSPILDVLLRPNYLFALEFAEGWLFGRVARRRICQYKPWPLIDSAGNPIDIAPNSHQSELRLRDPRNTANEILYLDATTNSGYAWFFHGSIGIKPEQVLMYLRFPEGKEIPGKFPNIDPIRPSAGDDVGYINEEKSPYDNPTDYVEIVIPPLTHMGAEFYNKDSARAHRPVLNLLFALYWVKFFDPEKEKNIVRRIASRDVPAHFMTVGFGDIPVELGDRLRADWGVKPISLDEALRG
jgi:hypothetical protein